MISVSVGMLKYSHSGLFSTMTQGFHLKVIMAILNEWIVLETDCLQNDLEAISGLSTTLVAF